MGASANSSETARTRLSRREQEVADLVAKGLTNRQIAGRLFISERTVDGHLEHIREKLDVNSRAQVAAWVVRRENSEAAGETLRKPVVAAAPRPVFVAHPRLWLATALLLATVAAGVGVLRLTAPPEPTIETFAGSACFHQTWPGGCWGGDGHLATTAWLARPTGVVVDSHGLVYIADFGNGRVRLVDRQGIITTVAGGGTKQLSDGALATAVDLGQPSALAVDVDNTILVLTKSRGRVSVWRFDQPFIHLVVDVPPSSSAPRGLSPVGPSMPLGDLAVSKDGAIFISDPAGNRVLKWFGGVLSIFAGTGEIGASLGDHASASTAHLAWPIGLALDKSGNLFIADALDYRIRRVDARSQTITTVAGSGSLEGDAGDGGPAVQARLSFPFGVAVGPDGVLVIADTGNHRLRVVRTDGIINALAGTGRWGFAGEHAPASDAELSGPEAVTFDAQGDLFIADTENQRVREIPRLFPPGS